jgi:Ca2+-binding EF-hand superfamily protein
MNKKSTVVALTLAAMIAASLSTAAVAREHGQGRGFEMNFEEMDANKDGKVTEAEIQAYRTAKLTALDVNKDGEFSAEELAAMGEQRKADRAAKRVERMIEMRDTDGNGTLSLAELTAERPRQTMFERLDTDKDGAISKAEADAAKERFAEHRGEGRKHKRGNN